jgi:hypothetical protein
MATAPVSRRLNLTRDQLAAFLTDHQQIRQFELLFSVVDELQAITGTDFEYQADTAAANANNALAQISALANDASVNDAALNAKVQQALDAIPGLAQALDLLLSTPRHELGTIASQNADNVNIAGGLISGLDAPLPVASGGTGVATVPAGYIPYGDGTNAFKTGSINTDGTNVGIGLTPSNWGTLYNVLEVGRSGDAFCINRTNGGFNLTVNTIFSASGFLYANNGCATYYNVSANTGNHNFYSAPTGIAGAVPTFKTVMSVLGTGGLAFNGILNYGSAGQYLQSNGSGSPTWVTPAITRTGVITVTVDYTVTVTDSWIINNKTGSTLILTFPAASAHIGRTITVKNMQAQAVNSASSNVVPIDSTTAGTSILLNVIGNWATIVSDGTNWVIMQAASNNNLLLE